MKNIYLGLIPGLLAVAIAGCASDSAHKQHEGNFSELSSPQRPPPIGLKPTVLANALSPDLLRPADSLFTLGPGDILDIEIPGIPTSRADATIGPDGKIYYSLLPGLDVWGLTLNQARELIEKELGKYLTQPLITLTLRTVGSRYVWVLGRLNRPGTFPLSGPMSLLEVIAQAGGTSRSTGQASTAELADLRHSFVVREGQLLPVDFDRLLRGGDLSQNIALQPDDFIYVPSTLSQEVYVLGAVAAPRAVAYSEPMTLVSAISGANGPVKYDIPLGADNGPFTRDAYLSHVAIVRGSVSAPQIAVVDYGAIVKGRAADVTLEAGDIIYVPNSPYTNLKRYFNTIMNTFVTTVAANEGIRAGGGKVSVGVSVPVGQGSSASSPAPSIGR
jgi:polysaccharide export outer membrane protein